MWGVVGVDSGRAGRYNKRMGKNMKKFAVGAFGLIAIAAGVLVFINYLQQSSVSSRPEQKPDEIVITDLPNGEKLVENKTLRFKTEVPNGFLVDQAPENYHFKAFIPEAAGIKTQASYQVDVLENPLNFALSEWLRIKRGVGHPQSIRIGAVDALTYSRQILVTDDNIPLPNSQEFLAFFAMEGKIFQLSCMAVGQNYQSLLDECKNKLLTFSFTE